MSKAIILLSGGLDSCVSLAMALESGINCEAITISYGQKHLLEIESARSIVKHYSLEKHLEFNLDLSSIGGSALTDHGIEVPKGELPDSSGDKKPKTYVPGRNIIFLSIALSFAEVRGADQIIIGANILDYSGYPDCRPDFLKSFQKMASLGTFKGINGNSIEINAPLIKMSKKEIILKGIELSAPLGLTWSCYDPSGKDPCKLCEACQLRRSGFEQAGYVDLII